MNIYLLDNITPAKEISTTFPKGSFSCRDFFVDLDVSALNISTLNDSCQCNLIYKNANGDVLYSELMTQSEFTGAIVDPENAENFIGTIYRVKVSLNEFDVVYIDINIVTQVNYTGPEITYTCKLTVTQLKPATISYTEDATYVNVAVNPSQNISKVHFGLQYDCGLDPENPDYANLYSNINAYDAESSYLTNDTLRSTLFNEITGLDTNADQFHTYNKNDFYALPIILKTIVDATEDITVNTITTKFRSYKTYKFTGQAAIPDLILGQTYNGTIDVSTAPFDLFDTTNGCIMYKLPLSPNNYFDLTWSGPAGSKIYILDYTIARFGNGLFNQTQAANPGTAQNIGYFAANRQMYALITTPITGNYSLLLTGV